MTVPNRIFTSTACLSGVQPLPSRIDLYRDHGLTAIELGAGVSVEKRSLSQIAKMEIQFLVHNYFPPPSEPFVLNLASSDEWVRQRSLAFVCSAIDLSARLNAPFYSVHAGFITDPSGFGKDSFVFPEPDSKDAGQFAMERFVGSLEAILGRAQRVGVRILIENNVCTSTLRGKLLLQTADEFLTLFRHLSSPYLGVLLDIGHLNVTARTLSLDRVAFVNKLTPHIRAFHVHDNDGTVDMHLPIMPDSWAFDLISRSDFMHLPLVIEARFRTMVGLFEHVKWLRRELRRE